MEKGKYLIDGNRINLESKCDIEIYGTNNTIYVGKNVGNPLLTNKLLKIQCHGDGNSIFIDMGVTHGNDCSVTVSDGGKIIIGRDCMLSNEVIVFNKGGEIRIGEHVWLGLRSQVLNNVVIGDGSILGACSIARGFYSNNVVIAGKNGRVIKVDSAWGRERDLRSIEGIPAQYRKETDKTPIVYYEKKKVHKNVITIGSRLLDDTVIASKGRLTNKNRIVDINPISFCSKEVLSDSELEELLSKMHFENDYMKYMFSIDIGRKVRKIISESEVDAVLFDISSIRIPIHSFSFASGEKVLITEKNAINYNKSIFIEYLEMKYGQLVEEEIIDPMKYTDAELSAVMNTFLSIFDSCKIDVICIEVHLVPEYISMRKSIELVDNQNVISYTNGFLDKLHRLLPSNYTKIPLPTTLFGNEKDAPPNMLSYNRLYYDYLVESVISLEECDYFREKYEVMANKMLEETIISPLARQVNRLYHNRKIVLIGDSNSLRYTLEREYGILVNTIIEYDSSLEEEELRERFRPIAWKEREYFCVLPKIYNEKVIRALWKCGYGINIGYCVSLHAPLRLVNFQGHYEDWFNNVIDSKSPVTVELRGCGSRIIIDTSAIKGGNTSISVLNGVDCRINKAVKTGKNTSLLLYDGAMVHIEDDAILDSNVHIRGGFNSTTNIANKAIIEEEVVIFNGDGHAIIDLKNRKNINYIYDSKKECKHIIRIGVGSILKKGAFVLAGTTVPDFFEIESGTLVNSSFIYN